MNSKSIIKYKITLPSEGFFFSQNITNATSRSKWKLSYWLQALFRIFLLRLSTRPRPRWTIRKNGSRRKRGERRGKSKTLMKYCFLFLIYRERSHHLFNIWRSFEKTDDLGFLFFPDMWRQVQEDWSWDWSDEGGSEDGGGRTIIQDDYPITRIAWLFINLPR